MTATDRKRFWRTLGLPTLTANCLANAGIADLEDLSLYQDKYLLAIPGFGKKSLAKVREMQKRQSRKPPPWG